MSATPWLNWPLKLPEDQTFDPTKYAEFKALHDREFLSKMTAEIRQNAVTALRRAYIEKTGAQNADGVALVIMGGQSADWEFYCSDTDKANFRQEAFFMHLFQVNEPNLFGIINLTDATSALAVPFLPPSAARWNGDQKTTAEYSQQYGLDTTFIGTTPEGESTPVSDFLQKQKIHTVLLLRGYNNDSGLWTKTTAIFDGMEAFIQDKVIAHPVLAELQSVKTDLEVEYIARCCQMSARAHAFVMANIRPCFTELQCEALFMAYVMFFGGSRASAYTCICGSGPNGSILHYGHAAHPNARALGSNEMIVLDMGGEYNGYATDLTRTYPTGGKFTPKQAAIFNIVRQAQVEVYAQIKPGAFWPDLHRVAERVIIQGLIEIGILIADVDTCIANFIGSVFMPHGLGHLMGLNVHGVGGMIDAPEKSTDPGVCWLRLGRKLKKNMVLTVEPGLYFNKSWITSQLENPAIKACINVDLLEEYWDFGGVRLEDDIVVTENGYEMLTGPWPTTIEEIEQVCAIFKNE